MINFYTLSIECDVADVLTLHCEATIAAIDEMLAMGVRNNELVRTY